jgi:hypothetical protein
MYGDKKIKAPEFLLSAGSVRKNLFDNTIYYDSNNIDLHRISKKGSIIMKIRTSKLQK